ncbi:hypothetical protein D3C71_1240410 [compost metagenome]
MLQPGEVGISLGRYAIGPARIFSEFVAAPVGDVERRVGKHVVGPQGLVLVVGKGVAVGGTQVAVQTVDGEVHQCQAAGCRHKLLAVNGQVTLLLQRGCVGILELG